MVYQITVWPVYVPASVQNAPDSRIYNGPVIGFDGTFLLVEESGRHREEIRTFRKIMR